VLSSLGRGVLEAPKVRTLPEPFWGAYDSPPGPLVGWGRGLTPLPQTSPPSLPQYAKTKVGAYVARGSVTGWDPWAKLR